VELAGANKVQTDPTGLDRTQPEAVPVIVA
jgi:hypothetical protein